MSPYRQTRFSLLLVCSGLVFQLLLQGCSRAEDQPASQVIQAVYSPDRERDEFHSWKFIVLHHSATSSGSVESIHSVHKQRRDSSGNPWRGIGYHFVIGNGHGMTDGEIQATFRWLEQTSGAHAGDRTYNNYGIGICLIGNFEETAPTPAQMQSLQKLVTLLRETFHMNDDQVLGHKDVKATACPGRHFNVEYVLNAAMEDREGSRSAQRTSISLKSDYKEERQNVATHSKPYEATRSLRIN